MEDIFRKKIRESIFLDTWIAQPKPKIDIEEMLVTKIKMIWIFVKNSLVWKTETINTLVDHMLVAYSKN